MLYSLSEATPVRPEPFDKLRTGYAAAAAKSKDTMPAHHFDIDMALQGAISTRGEIRTAVMLAAGRLHRQR